VVATVPLVSCLISNEDVGTEILGLLSHSGMFTLGQMYSTSINSDFVECLQILIFILSTTRALYTEPRVLLDSCWSPSTVQKESTWSPSGVDQESIRSPSRVHSESMWSLHSESIRSPTGVYMDSVNTPVRLFPTEFGKKKKSASDQN